MRVDYTVNIWREAGQFVAHAQPIDVMSSGASPEAARAAVDEAVSLFLSTARAKGTLEQVLEECSYVFRDGAWHAPEWISTEHHSVRLTA